MPTLEANPPSTTPSLGTIQETMLITLWARARESLRADAIIRDERSIDLCNAINYDFDQFRAGWKSQIGVAVRDRLFDRIVRDFLKRHPEATIINLGAGLDLRFFRVDNGTVRWFDLDLPDAIALRRIYIKETDRLTFLEGSALDAPWMEYVRNQGNRPTLLIAEGVLMFFEQEQVRDLFDRYSATFRGGEMLFDCIGPLMVRFPFLHDTLPRTKARFTWGVRKKSDILKWGKNWQVRDYRSLLDECPDRWRWMRWCRLVPALRRQFFALHLKCGD